MNSATQRKRTELSRFIQQEVTPEMSVQGVVVIGSVARGIARADSDIDVVVFLDPFDLYAIPAEFQWRPEDGTFHGIFSDVENSIQLDCKRLNLQEWSKPTHVWPESLCAELSEGWPAFDRHGQIWKLIVERTSFNDDIRRERLDDALVRLDWLLNDSTTEGTWERLGPEVAHSRLHSAFDYLTQALFAYNRRWRTWRSREIPDLLKLPWLPERFDEQLLLATNALSVTKDGYQQRVATLQRFFQELLTECQQAGMYGSDAVSEAFIRQHDEPGRDWNMDEWNKKHRARNR
ncbi:MAG TPA: nucleotidyltransferase domain-containing protein [Anaerolineales bacterium]